MHNISTLTLFDQNGTEPSLLSLPTPVKVKKRPNFFLIWLLCMEPNRLARGVSTAIVIVNDSGRPPWPRYNFRSVPRFLAEVPL